MERHEFEGYSYLSLSRLTPGKPYTHTGVNPEIKVEVLYKPFAYYTSFEEESPVRKAPMGTPQGGGLLVVIIHEGYDLKEKHHSNPYVSLLFKGELRKTKVCF